MAASIQWLDQAKEDLRAILDFISRENPKAAKKYVEELQSACARLTEFPLSAPQYDRRFRALVFRNHLAFYIYDEDARIVSIAMVLDGRRDIANLIETRSPEERS